MFSTRLKELLGIELPIIAGTLMDLSLPPFVTAVCEAGALGILPSVAYKDYDQFRDAIKTIKDGTDRPFAVNINLFPMMQELDHLQYLAIMAEEGVSIVETSGFAPPEDLVGRFKDYGMIWMHKCVGVRYASKAENLGADAVVMVGFENGGASGNLDITTMVLVPRTVDTVSIPVAAGGGVVDGRTMLAVFTLGADGAYVGTRLVLSEECPVHSNVKQALLGATELDTKIIMRSVGFPHRVWMNTASKKAAEVEAAGGGVPEIYPHVSGEALREMYSTGDVDRGSMACSQGIGMIDGIKPVKVILDEMMQQAREALDSLQDRLVPAGNTP
jgi:nitronate monooxygenase